VPTKAVDVNLTETIQQRKTLWVLNKLHDPCWTPYYFCHQYCCSWREDDSFMTSSHHTKVNTQFLNSGSKQKWQVTTLAKLQNLISSSVFTNCNHHTFIYLFGNIARMDGEADVNRILLESLPELWDNRTPPGSKTSTVTWPRLRLLEARDAAQNRLFWRMLASY